jgi:hypothetical protein
VDVVRQSAAQFLDTPGEAGALVGEERGGARALSEQPDRVAADVKHAVGDSEPADRGMRVGDCGHAGS